MGALTRILRIVIVGNVGQLFKELFVRALNKMALGVVAARRGIRAGKRKGGSAGSTLDLITCLAGLIAAL